MAALYHAFKAGTITNNPLTDSGTSITSAGFASLPVVASPDYLWLALDPLAADGAPELVKVTVHTSSSTTVTVERGQQTAAGGGAAREHVSGTVWQHVLTPADLDAVAMLPEVDFVATEESTTSTTPTDLSTAGPSVTMETGTLVRITSMCELGSPISNAWWYIVVSGATTIAYNTLIEGRNINGSYANNPATHVIPVNAGVNTFTMKYAATSGTATFKNRRLIVERLN